MAYNAFNELDELDNALLNNLDLARDTVERRKQILSSLSEAQKEYVDFIDRDFLAGDLTVQAYIDERRRLAQSYMEEPKEEKPSVAYKYKSLELDLGLLDGVIDLSEYTARKRQSLEELANQTPELVLDQTDQKLLRQELSPEEFIRARRIILDQVYRIKSLQSPDGKMTVMAQRLLFIITMMFGTFFIIKPELNYYSKLNTIVYVVVIFGGLYSYYRHTTPPPRYQPYVSVIIPVYNGEKDIYDVIKSHVQSDYPKDKLEIIIANDGSYDNTVKEIRRAIMDFPDTYVKHLPYKKNGGKRKVIRKALSEATGEVIVRCDADTYVRKDSIGLLVSHLKDKNVGGVTGRTYVKNDDDNIITKMQYVRYNYGFQQLYPFHNLLGSVFCLPGCFSAYDREAIEQVVDDWASTKPSLSEDRHLCHMLLERGYKPKYVKDAACDTVVPNTLKGYVRQQVRWAKANAVQQLRSTNFMYKIDKRLFLMYLVTYFISITTPYAILRLLFVPHSWFTWIIIVTLASLGRGLIVEGFSINALYAIPLFYFHLLLDLWKTPLGMLTISEKS